MTVGCLQRLIENEWRKEKEQRKGIETESLNEKQEGKTYDEKEVKNEAEVTTEEQRTKDEQNQKENDMNENKDMTNESDKTMDIEEKTELINGERKKVIIDNKKITDSPTLTAQESTNIDDEKDVFLLPPSVTLFIFNSPNFITFFNLFLIL